MKHDAILVAALVLGLGTVVLLSRWIDRRHTDTGQFSEQQLYLSGPAAKRLTLAFNGLAADLYWMRSLQYVGRKVIGYEDSHQGEFALNDLSALDLRLLPSLLSVTTTLDPQFLPAYEYGAMILPEVNPEEAISLLNRGIASNPDSWRLYQHLGYVYWQRGDYEKASTVYATGSRLPGAAEWMAAMAARMKADGGSRDAAREMYQRLYEVSNDQAVKEMVTHQLMWIHWLDDRELITQLISDYRAQQGRCPQSWPDLSSRFRGTRLRIDPATGAPVDPSQVPYRLINGGCDVDLDQRSKVPHV